MKQPKINNRYMIDNALWRVFWAFLHWKDFYCEAVAESVEGRICDKAWKKGTNKNH